MEQRYNMMTDKNDIFYCINAFGFSVIPFSLPEPYW